MGFSHGPPTDPQTHSPRDPQSYRPNLLRWRGRRGRRWRRCTEVLHELQFGAAESRKRIAVQREQPGFALVEREEETSPAIDRRPGGGSINLRVRILLPADPVHWTEEIRNRVYADLAQRSIGDFADAVKLFLYSLVVQKEDYGAYCDRVGIRRPYFWFGAGRQPEPSRGREMRGWLKEIFKRPRRPKAVVLAEARNKFPGISEAAVKRAWRDLAPPAWKQGGAPRKARRPGSAAK